MVGREPLTQQRRCPAPLVSDGYFHSSGYGYGYIEEYLLVGGSDQPMCKVVEDEVESGKLNQLAAALDAQSEALAAQAVLLDAHAEVMEKVLARLEHLECAA